MPKYDGHVFRLSAWDIKPWEITRYFGVGSLLGFKFHGAIRAAQTNPCQGVDNAAQTFDSTQCVIPFGWGIAIHFTQKIDPIRSAQSSLDLVSQIKGLLRSPLWH